MPFGIDIEEALRLGAADLSGRESISTEVKEAREVIQGAAKNRTQIQNSINNENWKGSGRIVAPKRFLGSVWDHFKDLPHV